MTISIARSSSTDSSSMKPASRVQPADVWDLDRRSSALRNRPTVRTLGPDNRKYEHRGAPDRVEFGGGADSFESRRETAGAAVLGALFGVALIVGSAFGGAFSGGDAGFISDNHGTQMAAVSQH